MNANPNNTSRTIRPELLAVLTCAVAVILAPLWMLKTKPSSGPDPVQATATTESVGAADSDVDAASGEGAAGSVISDESQTETLAGAATATAQGTVREQRSEPVAGAESAAPAGGLGATWDLEYQQRVSQAVERAYSSLARPNGGPQAVPSGGGATARTPTGTHTAAAGVRGYVQSRNARRAVSEELRLMRRAAIAEANRPANK